MTHWACLLLLFWLIHKFKGNDALIFPSVQERYRGPGARLEKGKETAKGLELKSYGEQLRELDEEVQGDIMALSNPLNGDCGEARVSLCYQVTETEQEGMASRSNR